MTKAPEHGDNEITEEVRREAQRTGRDLCEILRERLRDAVRKKDKELRRKIVEAQKFLGCRNQRKRRRR